jgi:hypothetical protein
MTGVGPEVVWILSCLGETRKGENHTNKVGQHKGVGAYTVILKSSQIILLLLFTEI